MLLCQIGYALVLDATRVTEMDPRRQASRLTGDVDYYCVHP